MGKKRDVAEAPAEVEAPKKLYDVAKFLKSHLPEKSTSLMGHKVRKQLRVHAKIESPAVRMKKNRFPRLFSYGQMCFSRISK